MPSSTVMNTSKRPCEFGQSSIPALLNARRCLGHPSVGGRFTAGAASRSSQDTAILCGGALVPVGSPVPVERRMGRAACFLRWAWLSLRGLALPSKLTQ